MPIIDFTTPFYLISAWVLFVLCYYLSTKNKTNTIPCIMLLTFLTILIGHSIELSMAGTLENVTRYAKNFAFDEMFIFASFLAFLWLDHLQVEEMKKKSDKTKKSGKKQKIEDKIIEKDGLDMLWKKV